MNTFSYNQSAHIYIGHKIECPVPDTADAATIGLKNTEEYMYLDYMGTAGPLRSDLVEKKNIHWITATPAEKMQRPLRRVKITVNPDCELAPCEEYFVKVLFRQFETLDEQRTATKHGTHITKKTPDKATLLKDIATSLVNSFAKLENKLVKVYVDDSADAKTAGTLTEVKWGQKAEQITSTVEGIVIEELEQPWRLGVMSQHPVLFDVYTSQPEAICGCKWGVIEELAPETFVKNGKLIADYEYFHLGGRGDQFRGIGFPHNIPTTYLVDPKKEYDVITIHYSYIGSNHAVQKSEKDLIIVFPSDGGHALANQFIGEINTATGNAFNVKTL